AEQIVKLMNREDAQALKAVAKARTAIARAIGVMTAAYQKGGRFFFVGAGTSGRLGVLEAAECPPTFSTAPSRIIAIMAGGKSAVFRSQEGAEDSQSKAEAALRKKKLCQEDVVIGVAASGVTPFVRTALQAGKSRKAKTILVTCNPQA